MPIRVQTPTHGVVEFPDGTDEAVMTKALRSLGTPAKPSAQEPPRSMFDTALDVGKGLGKGALHSALDIAQMAATSGMLPGLSASANLPPEMTERVREATPYRNDAQKVGGGIETAIELAAPLKTGAQAIPKLARAAGPLALDIAEHIPVAGKMLKFARMAGRMMERAAPEAEQAVASKAAGRLVGGRIAKSAEQEMADAIAEVRGATATPKITTPPQPDLPAGYTPRTSVSHGPRNYFLKAAEEAPAKSTRGPVGLDDLPESWKGMTAPPTLPPRNIGGSELAGAYQQELVRRGLKPAAALKAVRNNPDLPPDVKTQILNALIKVAKGPS